MIATRDFKISDLGFLIEDICKTFRLTSGLQADTDTGLFLSSCVYSIEGQEYKRTHYSLLTVVSLPSVLKPADTTGLSFSWEEMSWNKTGLCLFNGLLEIQTRLGGKRICQPMWMDHSHCCRAALAQFSKSDPSRSCVCVCDW